MTNFNGGSTNRASTPQTAKGRAIRTVRNGDVGFRHDRAAVTNGNRGLEGGTTRPNGSRR